MMKLRLISTMNALDGDRGTAKQELKLLYHSDYVVNPVVAAVAYLPLARCGL